MGDPRHYILKVGTEDSLAQNFARNIRPFRREVAAYQLLRSCNHLAAPAATYPPPPLTVPVAFFS